jgi:hypothetical protein
VNSGVIFRYLTNNSKIYPRELIVDLIIHLIQPEFSLKYWFFQYNLFGISKNLGEREALLQAVQFANLLSMSLTKQRLSFLFLNSKLFAKKQDTNSPIYS